MKYILIVLGFLFFLLGLIGIFIPPMPIMLFFILAGACFLIWFLTVYPYMTKVKSISTKEALDLAENSNAIFIDVRKPESVKKKRIENSKHILIKDIEEKQIGDLIEYKDTPVIIVCYIGVNAKKAANLLSMQGFKHPYVLEGGMKAWNAESLPVIKEQ